MKIFFKSLVLLISLFSSVQAQNNTYLIWFTDKLNSPFSLSSPADFLSPRAISRRQNQAISLNSRDLPVNSTYIDSVRNMGVTILNRSKWLNAVSVYCTDTMIINQIQSLSFVNGTQLLKRQVPSPLVPKLDEEVINQGSPKTMVLPDLPSSLSYGPSFDQIHMLNGDLLHANGFQGQGMIIAVLDAGFLNADTLDSFDSLWANNQILGTWDFVSGNNQVFDDHSHGTMVLSLMGGNLPGQLIGTAPKAQYWLLRTEDAPTEYEVEEFNWVCGAEFADSVGADVINSSLGYTTFDNPAMNHTFATLDGNTAIATRGADYAASVGMVVCSSAGNSGASPWLRISVPSDADSVLCVAAVNSAEIIATFSSRGFTPDGRIKPDVACMGVNAVVQSLSGGTQTGNGTSFSSPILAGMCASLWQSNPLATNMQLIEAVKMSCDQYLNPDSLKGYGVPDFAQAFGTVTGRNIFAPQSDSLLQLNPNPFHDVIHFVYYSTDTQIIHVQLTDMNGKAAYSSDFKVNKQSYLNVGLQPGNELKQGIYILSVQTRNGLIKRKLIYY